MKAIRTFAALIGITILSCSPQYAADTEEKTGVDRSALSPDTDDSVQSFIDERFYAQSDVRHSFQTIVGEKIDCIDFAAQPTVRAMLGAGITIDPKGLPAAPPLPAGTPPPYKPAGTAAAFDKSLDVNGQVRHCPDGTVGMKRPDVAAVQKVGGITAYIADTTKGPRPLDPGQCPQEHDCYHQTTGQRNWNHAAVYSYQTYSGALTFASLHKPYVRDINGEHSLSEIWIQTNNCESWTVPYGTPNTCSTSQSAPAANRAVPPCVSVVAGSPDDQSGA